LGYDLLGVQTLRDPAVELGLLTWLGFGFGFGFGFGLGLRVRARVRGWG